MHAGKTEMMLIGLHKTLLRFLWDLYIKETWLIRNRLDWLEIQQRTPPTEVRQTVTDIDNDTTRCITVWRFCWQKSWMTVWKITVSQIFPSYMCAITFIRLMICTETRCCKLCFDIYSTSQGYTEVSLAYMFVDINFTN